MGIDEWMTRTTPPLQREFVMEDYPGYTDAILECLTCEARFEGLHLSPPAETFCPRCHTRGVRTIRVIRKIYYQ
jgi:uncharacterized paraquat-inducible protein A